MRPTKNKPKNKLSVKTRSPRKPAVNKPARPKRAELSEDILLGRNAVREAIKSGRSINRILIAEGSHGGSISEIINLAKERHLVLQSISTDKLDTLCGGQRHQGIAAYAAPVDYVELDDILNLAKDRGEDPFLILLDELEDPHNLGAILRTADAVGAHGILIPKHRSCPLSSVVAKTSAGAVEYVPVARIGNVAQTLEGLKKQGLWVAGADMDGTENYYEANLTGPIVLVIGSEGHGVSRLTKEACDFIVKIPMRGKVNSLNASNAAAILAYEILKQRTLQKK
ncbi:23S rRNA (guanosine(2251)-2'-O)-methyltransferase RlmB [Megamonas hypermegale]|uniref:23S rRNA (guanosine(2251)-2'-O)-methyltransferase RlmB n=2 Tax=Megamonas hypermegale TaxID=158847 RepID=UPI0025A49CDF|nr:23S rRNA (guanosine(2251)-2'-O)-methyltransferase RlmB [Megamonas hypermegale]MDM8143844.1 23S rRNA (guanosine(2251)-2'-O)-methyltransferase RlmB [Megamonas hypermegale]